MTVISSIMSAASLLALCQGCAADSPGSPGDADGKLEFMPAPLSETAPDGVTTTLNIQDFKVTALYRGQYGMIVLLEDVVVSRTGLNSWEYSPKVDWPESPVDFYMVSPVSTDWAVKTWDKGAQIWQYENDGKTDLIVAADYNAVSRPGPIKVNFRHALAHVGATLATDVTEPYEIRVKMAYFSGVAAVAHYTWPTASTNQQNDSGIGTPENSGLWDMAGYNHHSDFRYAIFGDMDSKNEGTPLPSDGEALPLDGNGIQFMIPHKLLPAKMEDWGGWGGANLMVVYRIIDKTDNSVAWPTDETPPGQLFIPEKTWAVAPFHLADAGPDAEWLAGTAYSYRLTIHAPDPLTAGETGAATRARSGTHPEETLEIEVSEAPY